jgi:hypothetical protein
VTILGTCLNITLFCDVAISTSETSVNFYHTIRRNIPEDSHLHTRRRENLISHHAYIAFQARGQEARLIRSQQMTEQGNSTKLFTAVNELLAGSDTVG